VIDIALSGDVAHFDGRESLAQSVIHDLGRGPHRVTFWTSTPTAHAPPESMPPAGGRGAWRCGLAYYRDPALSWDGSGPVDPADLWSEVSALRATWGAASATSAAAALVSPTIAGRVSRDAPHMAALDSAIKGGLMWHRVGTWSVDARDAAKPGAPAPHMMIPHGWRIYALDQRSAYPWNAAGLYLPDVWGPEGGDAWAVHARVRVRAGGVLPGGPIPWRASHGGIEWATDAIGEGVWWAPLLEWSEAAGVLDVLNVRKVYGWRGMGQWLGIPAAHCVDVRDAASTPFQADAARAVGRRIFGVLATRPGRREWIPIELYAAGTLRRGRAGDPVRAQEWHDGAAMDQPDIELPDGRLISQPGAILKRNGRRWVSAKVERARPPFSEPAWAVGIESATTLETLEMAADLIAAGARVIYADTDGCVAAGPPGTIVRCVRRRGDPWRIKGESGAFACWGVKRYYLSPEVHAWSGGADVRELLESGVCTVTMEHVELGERVVRSRTLRVVNGALA